MSTRVTQDLIKMKLKEIQQEIPRLKRMSLWAGIVLLFTVSVLAIFLIHDGNWKDTILPAMFIIFTLANMFSPMRSRLYHLQQQEDFLKVLHETTQSPLPTESVPS